jgi:hypothetical protein
MRIPVRGLVASALAGATVLLGVPLGAQKIDTATRNSNRTQLAAILADAGPGNGMRFTQSTENLYNYSAFLQSGLRTADSIEVVAGATDSDTIFVRAFPKYKGKYVNVGRVKDPALLARQLLALSPRTFMFWATDETGDVYFGFTFTLESGFPRESIRIVLASIANHDQYLTEIKALLE